ncbi:hypothetical protein, partial [Bacillus cereus group sp. BC327]|uniref:hypothetical protein n=1 Tax=Bacillus cereus group sp. BC327 TaxID=3445309 RepID=UPI003F1F872C
DYILTKKRDYIHLDLIVLQIFRMLTDSFGEQSNDVPHWLVLALDQYNSPQLFREGVAGFVALTNRSTDHVNKTKCPSGGSICL